MVGHKGGEKRNETILGDHLESFFKIRFLVEK